MNNTAIAAAQPGDVLHDDRMRGLQLRCFPRRKVFYLYFRTRSGRERRPKVGVFGEITLAQARKIADDWLAVVRSGGDPVLEWNQARGEMTVAELFDATWKDHWDKPRFHKSGWAAKVRSYYDNNIGPRFAKNRLSEVRAVAVRNWHREYADRPYIGNRSLEVFSRMFNHAIEQEWLPQGANPCTLVEAYPERKRKRFATEAEIARVAQALKAREDRWQVGVAFLRVLFLTGMRPRALERATHSQLRRVDVDGQQVGLLLGEGKATAIDGQEDLVVFPPQALAVIDTLPRTRDDRLVPCRMPKKLWASVREEAGCPDLWARDSRRTFATVGMSNDINMDSIAGVLNHRSVATTSIYAKLMQTRQIAIAGSIADHVETLMGGSR